MESNKAGSKLIPIIAFIALILGVAAYGFFFLGREDRTVQGEAEMTEVRISSKVPGRIAQLLVEEGDIVRAGDTLAILSIPDIEAKRAQAEAAESGAEALNRKALDGARREQIEAARELWQQAVAGLDIARTSYERVERLFEKGVSTAQKRDEALANFRASEAREKAARAQYDMAVNGAESTDKLAARAQLARARSAVAEVDSYIAESYLIAPVAGRVSDRFVSVGELVGSGAPVMNISNLDDKWGVFNVREDKLLRFKAGETVTVYVPALDRDLDMKIYSIKDAGTYAVWKATKTLGDYDRKTFQIKARFVSGDEDIYPGMSLLIK